FGFGRVAGHFRHAGSVYAVVGDVLGPRAGFWTAWALLGTYLVFPAVSIMGVAIFGTALLRTSGLAPHAPWLPIALGAWLLILLVASRGIRVTTRSLLAFEGVSVLLILALMAV